VEEELKEEEEGEESMVIICLNCRKEVEVKLLSFGYGHAALCPECGKLAYNGK